MHTCHVEPTSSNKAYGHGVVRLSNLHPNTRPHDIHRKFRGVVWSAVQQNSHGRSLGYAFIRFRRAGNAATAIRHFNGSEWQGRIIHMYYNDEKPSRCKGCYGY